MRAPDPLVAAPAAASWAELVVVVRTASPAPSWPRAAPGSSPVSAPAGADVLLVGEAPGAQEDAAGVPFVGRSGQLLDSLLVEAGLPRERVAVANVLKCRPPANRTPRRAEVARCRPWLQRQVELVDPAVVVALGGTAAEWFFGAGARIAALRESPQRYGDRPVVVTYHPSAAIRFGPRGAPLAALREDLARAARLAAQGRRA